MLKTDTVVAIYHTHVQAEKAIQELQDAGVSLKSLSIAAKDTHTEEHAVGYYNPPVITRKSWPVRTGPVQSWRHAQVPIPSAPAPLSVDGKSRLDLQQTYRNGYEC